MKDDHTTLALEKNDHSLLQRLHEAGPPCLILYSGLDAGRRYDLPDGVHVVGRSAEAELFIDAPDLSRRHAELSAHAGRVMLRDLGSVNGTHVNDVRVLEATPVKDGDFLRLSNVLLRFHERPTLDVLLHDRVYRQATIDPGTGIFNRKYLHDVLKQEIGRARRTGDPLALICYDLDHFKQVNDSYGHAAGDLVLRESAEVVGRMLGTTATHARVGGEEFAVLLRATDRDAAIDLAERLRAAVSGHGFAVAMPGEGGLQRSVVLKQTMSLGVAVLHPFMADAAALLAEADRLLYAAKHGGRDRVAG